jgi:TP901 family phage tail tape measure protein
MRIVMGFKQMVTNVKEIDAAMVSLKKVTDETAEGYRRFFDEASEGAKKLSISIVDLINASADFARLGYNTVDAEKLGEIATVYKNVSEYTDINEASESIISTMKAFKEGATDIESATRAINAFNEVGKLCPYITVM